MSLPAAQLPQVDVLGVRISAVDLPTAVGEIVRWCDENERHYVCVTGVHGVMECQGDEDLRRIHNAAGLTTPDGMPMVWAGRYAGASSIGRVYGPDLMLELCDVAVRRGWRSFFYGGREGVAEQLAARLSVRFPGLKVAGCYSPPFRMLSFDEDDEIVKRINSSGADLVWVGLSTPKQERWMAAHLGRLDAFALLGVGAAFDFHAGLIRQAPRWIQRTGLEWLFRLSQEPRRLWKRYMTNNPRFALRVLRSPPRLIHSS
jgi:N-acetylglucosaminyldiphosphoundecaprenol N-acetyl-beta-D-mannosaminyltransferase